jgi:hypothetical protein
MTRSWWWQPAGSRNGRPQIYATFQRDNLRRHSRVSECRHSGGQCGGEPDEFERRCKCITTGQRRGPAHQPVPIRAQLLQQIGVDAPQVGQGRMLGKGTK